MERLGEMIGKFYEREPGDTTVENQVWVRDIIGIGNAARLETFKSSLSQEQLISHEIFQQWYYVRFRNNKFNKMASDAIQRKQRPEREFDIGQQRITGVLPPCMKSSFIHTVRGRLRQHDKEYVMRPWRWYRVSTLRSAAITSLVEVSKGQ